jgi:hypothetical protein
MSERLTNPFVTMEINAPVEFQEHFRRFSQTTGASSVADFDRKPFPRMVDFWFIALCVAVRKGLKPATFEGVQTYKAVEGPQIASPEWRAHALKLIAIAETGNPEVVKEPRRVLEIANGLAFAGMPHVLEVLNEAPDEAVLALSDMLEDLVA